VSDRLPAAARSAGVSRSTGQAMGTSMDTTFTSPARPVARPIDTVPSSPYASLRLLLQGVVQGGALPVDAIAEEAWPEVLGLASYHGVLAALATALGAPSQDLSVPDHEAFLHEYPRRVRAKKQVSCAGAGADSGGPGVRKRAGPRL
jgi:hypothetical protein